MSQDDWNTKPAPKETSNWRLVAGQTKTGNRRTIWGIKDPDYSMRSLRKKFPLESEGDGIDRDNVILFSTSGSHATYMTLEESQGLYEHGKRGEDIEVAFLIIHPRILSFQFGCVRPESLEDYEYLLRLRDDSHATLALIGKPLW